MRRIIRLLRALQNMKRARIPLGILIGVASGALANLVLARKLTFTPEGYRYAVRMMIAAGHRPEAARTTAGQFYAGQSIALDAENPARDRPAPYVLYPYAAAPLFEFRGFESLTDITRLSYIGIAVSSYLLLLNFASPWLSAALSLGLISTPRVRKLGAADTTDVPGLFLWTVTLDAMCRSMKCGTASQFVYALSCFALTFTRPMIRLPFGAATAALATAIRQRDAAKKKTSAAMLAVGTLSSLTFRFVCAAMKSGGVRQHLRDTYARRMTARRAAWQQYQGLSVWRRLAAAIRNDAGSPEQSIASWYIRAIALSLVNLSLRACGSVVPILAAAGIAARRDHPCAPLLVGAAAGSIVGILADPQPEKTAESVLLPLYPVIAAGCALGAEFLIDVILNPE